jgi:anthranilate phosphoribosyltransferase
METSFSDALRRVTEGADLAEDEAEAAFTEIVRGAVPPLLVAALLAALKTKGESAAEIAGAVRAMRAAAVRVDAAGAAAVDTCGTGGDRAGTLNVSTGAAVVAAAGGARVAKHGNRAASSRCGSADVLEALGVEIDLGPEAAAACMRKAGIAFLFAPRYHPAMRHAAEARRALGLRTIFNYLGPLTNPAGVRRQVIGVPDPAAFERIAAVVGGLGYEHCLVVHGLEGLDEVSLAGPTRVAEWREGELRERLVEPEDFRLRRRPLAGVRGGDPAENARALRAILSGERSAQHAPGREAAGGARDPEAAADIVALNAGAALYVGGVAATWEEGVERALAVLATGAGLRKLDAWIDASRAAGRQAPAGPSRDPPASDQPLHGAR